MLHTFLLTLALLNFSYADISKDSIKIYNWADYLDNELINEFTKETGIKVFTDYFDSEEAAYTKLNTKGIYYDVVFSSASSMFIRYSEEDKLESLDMSKIPNYGNNISSSNRKKINSHINNGHTYNETFGIPYLIGATGILYNKAQLGFDIDSWDWIFDSQKASTIRCGINMLDSIEEVLPLIAIYDEHKKNKHKKSLNNIGLHIDEYVKILRKVNEYISSYDSVNYHTPMAHGNLCVSVAWSGSDTIVKNYIKLYKTTINPSDIVFVYPDKKALLWYEMVSIMKNAKNKEGAYKFINFLLKKLDKDKSKKLYPSYHIASMSKDDFNYIYNNAIYMPYKSSDFVTDNRIWTSIVY